MLDWSLKTWHRRLTQWTYGDVMFYDTVERYSGYVDGSPHFEHVKEAKRINLCPYMRRLVIAVVAAPFLFVFRALDKKVWAQVTFIVGTLNLILAEALSLIARVSYLAGLEATVIGTGIMGGTFGAAVGLMILREKLHDRAQRKREELRAAVHAGTYKYPEPKGPNPLRAFIRAKHEKVCPEITWVEEKPVEQATAPAAPTESTAQAT